MLILQIGLGEERAFSDMLLETRDKLGNRSDNAEKLQEQLDQAVSSGSLVKLSNGKYSTPNSASAWIMHSWSETDDET